MPEKKTNAKMVSALLLLLDQGIWCDCAKTFRALFDQLIRYAVAEAQEYGNWDTLTKIVNGVPDTAQRRQIIRRIASTYPAVTYNLNTKRFEKDRRSALNNDHSAAAPSSVFGGSNFSVSKAEAVLHRATYTKNDIMELLLDVLTQYRNEFSEEDVALLQDIINRIQLRTTRRSRPVNTDQPI